MGQIRYVGCIGKWLLHLHWHLYLSQGKARWCGWCYTYYYNLQLHHALARGWMRNHMDVPIPFAHPIYNRHVGMKENQGMKGLARRFSK